MWRESVGELGNGERRERAVGSLRAQICRDTPLDRHKLHNIAPGLRDGGGPSGSMIHGAWRP